MVWTNIMVMFWDIRMFDEPLKSFIVEMDNYDSFLEYEPTIPSKFMLGLERNPASSKYFLTEASDCGQTMCLPRPRP